MRPGTGTAPRHDLFRSGIWRAIKPRRRVVRQFPMVVGHPDGLRRRRLCHCNERRWKRGDAHQTTALFVHRMRRFCRDRIILQHGRFRIMTCRRVHVSQDTRMMLVPVPVDMRHGFMVLVNHARDVTVAGQTMGGRVPPGQRRGDRRNEHAKQIGQGDKPPCPPPLRSGNSDQHECVNAFDYRPGFGNHNGEFWRRQADIAQRYWALGRLPSTTPRLRRSSPPQACVPRIEPSSKSPARAGLRMSASLGQRLRRSALSSPCTS